MNVLITGGNGFLGFNLVKKLLSEGHKLFVFSKDTSNLNSVMDQIQFGYGHTKDLVSFKDNIILFSPDIIIHCGWSGGNSYIELNDLKQVYDNIEPGIEFLKLLNQLPKKPKFIGFGSILEYGKYSTPANELLKENPIDLYGLSKLTFKNYSKMICDLWEIDWVWIRPSYIYGPYDIKTRLVPSLIDKFLKGEDVTLDECNKKIDYLYIDDFITLVYKLITSSYTGVYNICSGKTYNLKEMIDIIHSLSNSNSRINFDPSLNRKFASSYICGDNNKIITTFNLPPQIDIKIGLLKTINHHRNEL
jgi:nucleoside-diphosphate-sugar epimerase